MIITLQELKDKVDSIYMTTQKEEYGWSELNDTDKGAVLNNANIEFNRLQWIGKKASESQADAFPRIIYDEVVETPDNVKSAIAVYCMNYVRYMNDKSIQDMKRGVTSVHIGNYSETYKLELTNLELDQYRKYLVDWIYRGAKPI